MEFIATFIALAAGGLINASYLTYKHFQKKPLVCPIGHDCNAVTESRWGNIFGVRNEILGVVFYALVLLGAISLTALPGIFIFSNLKLYLVILTGGGLVFSIFLTLVQKFAIKSYCFYCLISAIISLFLFLNSLVVYLA